jgi:hypothetical protein
MVFNIVYMNSNGVGASLSAYAYWVGMQGGEIRLQYKSALPARSCLSAFANTFDANPSKYRWSSGASLSVFLSYNSCNRRLINI